MDLQMQGHSVIRVCFDMAFTILTSEGDQFRIQTDAVIHTPEQGKVQFDPENPDAAVTFLVRLMSDVITNAKVRPGSSLVIEFESAATLTVPPHIDYEAWGIVGRRGKRVVCMPGGQIAMWDEQ